MAGAAAAELGSPEYVRLVERGGRRRASARPKKEQQRLEQAIAQLPELKQKQAEAAQRAGHGSVDSRFGSGSRG